MVREQIGNIPGNGCTRDTRTAVIGSTQSRIEFFWHRHIHSPPSSLFDADNGTVFVEPIDSFSRDVAGRVSPASKGQAREAKVLLIDFLSPISATVKIRMRAHQSVFVDHLGFVLDADGWQIVSKIWHLESTVESDDQTQSAAV